MHIFYERSGEDAREVLQTFGETLSDVSECRSVQLLESAQQAELYLLVVVWTDTDEKRPEPPDGTKLWMFRSTEE